MTRKLPLFAALSAALFFLSISAERVALARLNGGSTITTVTQPDIWCQGGTNQGTANTATEVCLDWNGNILPTTTNKQTSGSSSLQWKSVETKALNAGGGAVAIGGQAGLLTLTTAQLILASNTPAAVGSIVAVQIVNGGTDNSVNGYAVCLATSVTTQSGTQANDIDWVYLSTKTTANIGKACY